MGEEQRRSQLGLQFLVEHDLAVVALQALVDDHRIDGDIALAATGGDDHVHRAAKLGIVLQPGIVERKTGGENAEALPVFHLPLIAALRDLRRPVDLRHRMDGIRLEFFRFENRLRSLLRRQKRQMRRFSDPERCDDADAGDDDIPIRPAHALSPLCLTAPRVIDGARWTLR